MRPVRASNAPEHHGGPVPLKGLLVFVVGLATLLEAAVGFVVGIALSAPSDGDEMAGAFASAGFLMVLCASTAGTVAGFAGAGWLRRHVRPRTG
jgi:hypothetical protein